MTGELAQSLDATDTRDIELRHSHLKAIARSPAHCRHAMVSGWDEPTLSKRLGSGVHSLLLGGPAVIRCPHKSNTNAYKEFAAKHVGDLLLSPAIYEKTHRIADALRADERASRLLLAPDAIREQTIRWEWMGRKRRTTPDIRNFSFLAEVKTTRNAAPDKFRWDVLRFGYHAQLADQALAIETDTGHRPREVFCLAIETAPPFVPVVYRLTPNDLEMGARLNASWMERFQLCEATGHWPGYAEAVMDLDLPSDDDRLVFADDDGDEIAEEGSE